MEEKISKKLDLALSKLDDTTVEAYNKFRQINRVENAHVSKKVIQRDLGKEPITIIPITDAHLGCKSCNIEKFARMLELINNTPNCYTVLLGDLAETATKTSVGLGVYEEDFNIPEQLKMLHNMLTPLAKKGKILGALTGNHEMRVAYAVKLNPMEVVAEQLGIPYLGYQGYISLKVGNQVYHLMVHHGASGGATPTGKLNGMRSLSKVAHADIYLSGHTHGRAYDHDVLYFINDETGLVEPRLRHYLVCGSFLEYWGGYAEMKLLAPATTGAVMLRLDSEVKDVQIII
jgi:UDP-2,3-diacylglucosamine pyrophosphatase LpxH